MSHIAGSLNAPRQNHGMSVKKIGKTFKLIAFGGESEEGDGLLDSIEVWNSQSETWEEPNSKRFKLQDKTSRFSTLTMFNGSRLTKSTNFSSSSTKNEPKKPFTPLNVFQGTRYMLDGRPFFLTIVAPITILCIVCTFCRMLPENLWLALKFLAWYEMISQSLYLSLSVLIGTNNCPQIVSSISSFIQQMLNTFSHSIVILPKTFNNYIHQFLNIVAENTDNDADKFFTLLILFFSALSLLFSRLFLDTAFNIRKCNMYHETLQVILFLSFQRVCSTLGNLNKFSKENSFLRYLTRIITDPIISLLYVALTMYSVLFLRFVSFTIYIIFVVYYNYLHPYIENFPITLFLSIVFWLLYLPMFIIFDGIVDEKHIRDSLEDEHLSAFLISRQSLKHSTLDMFYYNYLCFCTLSMKSMCNE